MAKKSPRANFKNSRALAVDLGGTKLLVAVVDRKGKVYDLNREPVAVSEGYRGLVRQIVRLARPLVKAHKLKIGAISAAGPLDPITGRLLNPTNIKTDGEFWGVVPLARDVSKGLAIPIRLDNDAAAAALAEAWIGESRKYKSSVALTLGTGLGVGVIANGLLVRAGQNLHTEGGHILLDHQEREWQCGCGNYGCAEAYLSGANFTRNLGRIWGRDGLRGEDLVALARSGENSAVDAFEVYGERLAAFIYSICMMFAPEVIVLSGGFSHAADLFMKQTEARLGQLMKMHRAGVDMLPKITISKFKNEAGLLGAACLAFGK